MLELQTDKMNRDYAETNDISISIGKIEENTQVTPIDYDGLDMVRAWYS